MSLLSLLESPFKYILWQVTTWKKWWRKTYMVPKIHQLVRLSATFYSSSCHWVWGWRRSDREPVRHSGGGNVPSAAGGISHSQMQTKEWEEKMSIILKKKLKKKNHRNVLLVILPPSCSGRQREESRSPFCPWLERFPRTPFYVSAHSPPSPVAKIFNLFYLSIQIYISAKSVWTKRVPGDVLTPILKRELTGLWSLVCNCMWLWYLSCLTLFPLHRILSHQAGTRHFPLHERGNSDHENRLSHWMCQVFF